MFDYTANPELLLYVQLGVIAIAGFGGFLFGLKRGFFKATWNLIASVTIYGLFIYVLSLFHLSDVLKPEMVQKIVEMINNAEVTKYYNMIIEADALNVVLAILDLVLKIVLFVVLNGPIRWLVQLLTFGIGWLFVRKIVGKEPKLRFLGGMVGFVKGSLFSVLLIVPSLVLMDAIVGDGIETDDPNFSEIAKILTLTYEQSIVHYINEIEIEDEGLANYMFDLVFTSKVENEEYINWRTELKWIGEGVKAVLPDISKIDNGTINEFDSEDFLRYEGFFTAFANSRFLDSLVKPGYKYALTMLKEQQTNAYFTDEFLAEMLEKVDEIEVSLATDLHSVYLAIKDLFTIQNLEAWQQTFNDPYSITVMSEEHQELFIGSLNRLTNLSLHKLLDLGAATMLYSDEAFKAISWLETEAEKVAFLEEIRVKIESFEGTFTSRAINDLTTIFNEVVFIFPGVDVDGNGENVLDFSGFLKNISDFVVVLNNDANYHTWFKASLEKFSDLHIVDTFMEQFTELSYNLIINSGSEMDEDQINILIDIIENNFATSEDLKRELVWIADVYKEIAMFGIAPYLKDDVEFIQLFDDKLTTQEGRNQFEIVINKILDGQTISELTNRMSKVLLEKYLTEPLELVEPLMDAMELSTFNFRNEIDKVVNVVLGLYEEGLVLADALAEDADIISTILPVVIEFVKNPDNKALVLDSNIMYSFINYNLKSVEGFEVPEVAYEKTGEFNGWIKKTELSTVLDIFGGLLTEMENQGVDISELLNGESNELITKLLPVIKVYAGVDENRELLLSSDILYYTLSSQLKAVDALEVPEEALAVSGDYESWIEKEELDKLLRAIILIDLDIPQAGESIDLTSITGEALRDVIAIDSLIIRRNITTQLINADLLEIPVPAFVTNELKDLKQEELLALAELLVTLELDLGSLGENSDPNAILNEVLVSNLTKIDYEESFIIRSFISFGIKQGLGDIHPLATNTDYPELLSNREIGELFKILNSLDEDGTMSVQGLMDNLNPESLTFKQVRNVVAAGDSIIIRGLLSENLLTIDVIKDLALKQTVYHHEGVTVYDDLISYDEVQRLVDSLMHLADSEDDFIMDLTESLDVNSITLEKITEMIGEGSLIVNTLVSTKVLETGAIDIHPNAFDADGEIMNVHLVGMMETLSNALGATTTITDLNTLADEITITDLREIVDGNSIILNYFMTKMIIDNLGEAYDRVLAHDINDELVFSNTEFNAIFNGLAVLDQSVDQSTPILQLVDNLNDLTLLQVSQVVASGSHILRAKISDELITNLGEDNIHPNAIETTTGDITQVELDKAFTALLALGATTKITELQTLADTVSISNLRDMVNDESLIINRYMTKMIIDNIGASYDRVLAHDPEDALLLSQTEFNAIFNGLKTLDPTVDESTPILQLVDNLNDLTLQQVSQVVASGSHILRAKISGELITNLGQDKIHPGAIETSTGDITQVELNKAFTSLLALGANTKITELANLANTVSIGNLRNMIDDGSLIINHFMTVTIMDNVGQQYKRELAFETTNPDVFTQVEFSSIFNGLASLDLSGDESTPIINLVSNLNDLELSQLVSVGTTGSHTLRAKLSEELIANLGEDEIHPLTIDSNNDIYQADLNDLFNALLILGPNTKVTELGTLMNDNLTLNTINLMRAEESRIFEGMLSRIMVRTMTDLNVEIREDAYQQDPVLGKDGFGMLTTTEMDKLFASIGYLAGGTNAPLASIVESVNVETVTPNTLTLIADEESIIIYRLITKQIIDSGMSVPTAALQANQPHDYLTKTELKNSAEALTASGATSLQIDGIDAETLQISVLRNIVAQESMIVNRKVSEGINNVGLDTLESHEGMEGNDIQTVEILNLFDAFEAFGMDELSDKDSLNPIDILNKSSEVSEAEFKVYIGYDELDENKGMTIFKDFLITKLDNQFPDLSNPGQNIRVETRQDLLDLLY